MAIPTKLALPVRLVVTLFVLPLWACSSGRAGTETPGNGSEQRVEGNKPDSASTAGKGATSDAEGGSNALPDDSGSGDTGSVGADDPEPADRGEGGSGSEPVSQDSAGAGGAAPAAPEPAGPSEAFLRGQTLVAENQCVTCHQQNFAGFTVFPNITPDVATGIGSWTDAQIISAIREGVNAEGVGLCVTMQRYPLSDDQASDVVAFLRGLPAVDHRITSVCPGHGQ